MTDASQNSVEQATVESLETRQLMSGVMLSGGTLTVTGLATSTNTVSVTSSQGKVHAVLNGRDTAYTLAGVKQINIVGGIKADKVTVSSAVKVPVHVATEGGADQITGVTSANVTKPGSIASLQLIDADTGKVVSGYTSLDGTETLNLAKLPKHLTIAANLSGGAGTVRFDYDGKTGFKVENAHPYALAGDGAGKYNASTFTVGTHTLTANVVYGSSVLSSKKVTLKVVNQGSTSTTGGTTTGGTTSTGGTKTGTTGATKPTNPSTGDTPPTGDTHDAGSPDAAITAISRTIPAGTSVQVDALATKLVKGDWNDGQYYWDFGDKGSAENAMRGFNAAHVYDKAGTYTVTLKVVNAAGKTDTTTMTVTVTPANRKVIYVSDDGSDDNSGLSQSSPIKSIAKALTLVDDNTEILFRRGDEFDQTQSFEIRHSNVVIGAYGIGDRPKILWTGERENDFIFYIGQGTNNVTVQDLSIDTIFNKDTDDHGTPMAFKMGGTNFTARNNELLNLQYGFMLNMNPSGVNIVDNTAPLLTGIRKYFAWVQGDHVTIDGNYCANSTREHIVRANFVHLLNVSENDFSNISRQDQGDVWDYRKTAVNVQSGDYAYVYNNKLNASLQVGPLGKTEGMKGEMSASMRFNYAIAEDNEVIDDQIVVNHGAQHITFRDNVVHDNNGEGIQVDGYNDTYKRGVVDLTLDHNTVTNDGTQGSFIDVSGPVDGIVMTDNLYVAPNLVLGAYGTAAVKIASTAYDSFTEIDGNVWPVAGSISKWVGGEQVMNYVGDGYTLDGMKTADEWNKLSIVGTDTFKNVDTGDGYSLTLNANTVGARLAA